ncbi:MAG: signal peptidase II [Proteobacteria bacterium]|nr:signal peptidase II [Pseudomonadota bacterium]
MRWDSKRGEAIYNPIKKAFIALLIALCIALLDCASKYFMISYIQEEGRYGLLRVTSFLNFVIVWNNGISFGIFDNGVLSSRYLILISLIVILIIFIYSVFFSSSAFSLYCCACAIGGGIGNCFDRIINDAVFDFIDFHVLNFHYPAFNIADSVIVCSILLLMINESRKQKIEGFSRITRVAMK